MRQLTLVCVVLLVVACASKPKGGGGGGPKKNRGAANRLDDRDRRLRDDQLRFLLENQLFNHGSGADFNPSVVAGGLRPSDIPAGSVFNDGTGELVVPGESPDFSNPRADGPDNSLPLPDSPQDPALEKAASVSRNRDLAGSFPNTHGASRGAVRRPSDI